VVYVKNIMLHKISHCYPNSKWSTKEIKKLQKNCVLLYQKHLVIQGIHVYLKNLLNNSILTIQINNTRNKIGLLLCLGKHSHHKKFKINLGNKVGEDLPMKPCMLILILCNNNTNSIYFKPNIPHKSN
jgi:hypothetical protein